MMNRWVNSLLRMLIWTIDEDLPFVLSLWHSRGMLAYLYEKSSMHTRMWEVSAGNAPPPMHSVKVTGNNTTTRQPFTADIASRICCSRGKRMCLLSLVISLVCTGHCYNPALSTSHIQVRVVASSEPHTD